MCYFCWCFFFMRWKALVSIFYWLSLLQKEQGWHCWLVCSAFRARGREFHLIFGKRLRNFTKNSHVRFRSCQMAYLNSIRTSFTRALFWLPLNVAFSVARNYWFCLQSLRRRENLCVVVFFGSVKRLAVLKYHLLDSLFDTKRQSEWA